MRKILQVIEIRNLLTVEIEGLMKYNKIGDIIKDDNNNQFKITSVAIVSGLNVGRNNTTLVVEPLGSIDSQSWGRFLHVE